MAVALETIAARLHDPARIATLEELLKEFVALMEDQRSTDKDWADLLFDTKQALGRETHA